MDASVRLCHLVASSLASACRGAVSGTLQGHRSGGRSCRLAARVRSGSAESRADRPAVREELCRRRDQVRNEDRWEVVVATERSRWRFCCSLCVVVEDVSSSACVTVKVFPYMTVAALKQQVRRRITRGAAGFPSADSFSPPPPQVFFEYGFHPRVQRWVIGQCLCTEPRSLASYGAQKDGDTAYLYLISARQARITRQLFQQDLEGTLLAPPIPPGNGPASQEWRGYSTLPSRLNHSSQGAFSICKRLVASFITDNCDQNCRFLLMMKYPRGWKQQRCRLFFCVCQLQVAQGEEATDKVTSKISLTWRISTWTITAAREVKRRCVGSLAWKPIGWICWSPDI